MILVTVGTHHQSFARLVRAADDLARRGHRVFIQAGVDLALVEYAQASDWLAPAELERLADEAAVIVSHGGPASLFLAWERGLRPVVVPRRAALGEHVDDHQVHFAKFVRDRVWLVDDVARLGQQVAVAGQTPRVSPEGPARSERFSRRLAGLVDDLVSEQRRGSLAWRRRCGRRTER